MNREKCLAWLKGRGGAGFRPYVCSGILWPCYYLLSSGGKNPLVFVECQITADLYQPHRVFRARDVCRWFAVACPQACSHGGGVMRATPHHECALPHQGCQMPPMRARVPQFWVPLLPSKLPPYPQEAINKPDVSTRPKSDVGTSGTSGVTLWFLSKTLW